MFNHAFAAVFAAWFCCCWWCCCFHCVVGATDSVDDANGFQDAASSSPPAGNAEDVLTGTWQTKLPGLNPAVGNGLLGWVVGSDSVFSAGLFCARDDGVIVRTHHVTRARIATPAALRVFVPNATSLGVMLDVRRAVVEEQLVLKAASATGDIAITRRWYAHRSRPSLLVLELELASNASAPAAVQVSFQTNTTANVSSQLTLAPVTTGVPPTTSALLGRVTKPEPTALPINISVVATNVPDGVSVPAGGGSVKVVLLASIVTDAPFLPFAAGGGGANATTPSSPNATFVQAANALVAAAAAEHNSSGALLQEHVSAWRALWDHGGVEIVTAAIDPHTDDDVPTAGAAAAVAAAVAAAAVAGKQTPPAPPGRPVRDNTMGANTLTLAQQVNASLYHLLMSTREDVPYVVVGRRGCCPVLLLLHSAQRTKQ